jgi:hypothetical protein
MKVYDFDFFKTNLHTNYNYIIIDNEKYTFEQIPLI